MRKEEFWLGVVIIIIGILLIGCILLAAGFCFFTASYFTADAGLLRSPIDRCGDMAGVRGGTAIPAPTLAYQRHQGLPACPRLAGGPFSMGC